MRAPIMLLCTADPPGQLIASATAETPRTRKARSSIGASCASSKARPTRPPAMIAPCIGTTATTGWRGPISARSGPSTPFAGRAGAWAGSVVIIILLARRQVEERFGIEFLFLLPAVARIVEAEGFEPFHIGWQRCRGAYRLAKALLHRHEADALLGGRHGLLFLGLLLGRDPHGLVQRDLRAEAKRHRVHGLDVRAVPMGTRADRLDGRTGRADQLGDLAVLHLRVVADEPGDCSRAILTLGDRRVARPAALLLRH